MTHKQQWLKACDIVMLKVNKGEYHYKDGTCPFCKVTTGMPLYPFDDVITPLMSWNCKYCILGAGFEHIECTEMRFRDNRGFSFDITDDLSINNRDEILIDMLAKLKEIIRSKPEDYFTRSDGRLRVTRIPEVISMYPQE